MLHRLQTWMQPSGSTHKPSIGSACRTLLAHTRGMGWGRLRRTQTGCQASHRSPAQMPGLAAGSAQSQSNVLRWGIQAAATGGTTSFAAARMPTCAKQSPPKVSTCCNMYSSSTVSSSSSSSIGVQELLPIPPTVIRPGLGACNRCDRCL